MSVQAVSWVLRGGADGACVDVPSSRHVGRSTVWAVLVVLAEHADVAGRGSCPSQDTIARECGTDRRTVRHAIAALEEAELIVPRAAAVPRRHGIVYDLPHVDNLNCGGIPRHSNPQVEDQTVAGYPATVVRNSGGDSGGDSGGIPRHEPEPEPLVQNPRDSYASSDRLTVEQIRQLRLAKIDEGRNQLDAERRTQRTKNSSTAVA